MSDDQDVCFCILALAAITFSFMTIASPVFLLYGFFSGEWLIENRTSLSNTTGEDTIIYGLYRKCHNQSCSDYIVDKTTFDLGVTSVVFQFLAILALPWLKPWLPDNKYLRYWNYCFIPFLFMAAIFSLSAYSNFSNVFDSKTPYLSFGSSAVSAALGGSFQIVLACIITYFFWRHNLLCFKRKSRPPVSVEIQSTAETTVNRTENIVVALFAYSSVSVDGEVATTKQKVVAARLEEHQVATGYGRQIERY